MKYDQPFFVGVNNPRFPTGRNGYLPALESPEEVVKAPLEEPWAKRQWDIINQLRGMVRFLYSKETERRANASKRRPLTNNILTSIYSNSIYKGAEQDSEDVSLDTK